MLWKVYKELSQAIHSLTHSPINSSLHHYICFCLATLIPTQAGLSSPPATGGSSREVWPIQGYMSFLLLYLFSCGYSPSIIHSDVKVWFWTSELNWLERTKPNHEPFVMWFGSQFDSSWTGWTELNLSNWSAAHFTFVEGGTDNPVPPDTLWNS